MRLSWEFLMSRNCRDREAGFRCHRLTNRFRENGGNWGSRGDAAAGVDKKKGWDPRRTMLRNTLEK